MNTCCTSPVTCDTIKDVASVCGTGKVVDLPRVKGYVCETVPCSKEADGARCCGTAITCTTPSDRTGYTIKSETSTKVHDFAVSVECAPNYYTASKAEAKRCDAAGPYSLSGCAAITCTTPSPTTGYAIASEKLDAPNFAVGFTNGECAAGYEGTPKAEVCTSDKGAYTLKGCTAMKCGALPAGKGYKSGKDATASCGGKCEDMCFEPLKCGSVAIPAGKKLANGKSVSTPCGTTCLHDCFVLQPRCGSVPTPVGKKYAAGKSATTLCGGKCEDSCFVDLKCGTKPPKQVYATGKDATTPCGGVEYTLVKQNAYCGNRLCKDGVCAHSRKADSAQKCAELVMSDAKCGDAFSYSTAEKYCDCPPDGSHCTLADLSSGGYGVYEFQTCGEACFVDVMCTRPSTPGYAIETETLNAPSFAVKFKNNACATGYAGSPNAEPCSSAGPYKLSGCTAFKCTRPTTPGYPAPASETLDAPGFKRA